MTVGQGDPTSINAAAGTSDVARRVQMMSDQGHQWMDPQTTLALANSNMSDGSLSAAAQQLKGMFNSSTAAVSHVFTDPVLQKTPSFTSSLAQWMGSNVGYLPVEQSDLAETQKKLQALGYGAGLPTDGTWDSSWNDQYQQAAYKHLLEQSNQVGQVIPPHKVAHGFLSSLFPSHAIPALWGMVKSTPGDLRSLAADVAGGGAAAVQGVVGGFAAMSSQNHTTAGLASPEDVQARVAATVEHGLGNEKITAQNIKDHPTARMINDMSTLLMFLPVGKAVSPLAKSLGHDILEGTVKDAFTRTLDQQVAQRGPGIIANSLVRNSKGAGFDALGKLTNNGLFKNIPALKYLYPNIIKPTAAEDGWYYSTRRALAQPMRIPVVNLGARTAQYTNLLGAEAQGVAALDSRITGKDDRTQISNAVYGEGTISGLTGAALDAVLTLGRPTLGAKPSEVVGSTFRALENTSNKALGGVNNVPLQFDRAMQGSDVSYSKLVAEHGKLRIDSYLNAMLDRFAAANSARAQMQADIAGGAPALDGEAYDQRFTDLAHAARNDPEMLNAAKAELLVNSEDMAHAFWTQRDDIAENMGKNSKGFATYLDAIDHGRNLVRDWGDTLVHPGVWEKVAQDRQVIKDQNEAEAALGPWTTAYHNHRAFLDAAAQQDDNPAVRVHETIHPTEADHAAFAAQGAASPAAEGMPPVFHGSKAALPATPGDRFMGAAADNLFGPGLYTTDSEKIAQQYARGGSHYALHVTNGKKPKLLDLDAEAPAWLRESVKSAADSAGVELSDVAGQSAANLIRHLREELSNEGLTTSHADEIVHGITDTVDARGYDAMTHVGGIYASKTGERHQVYIWLHPEDMTATPRLSEPSSATAVRKMTDAERHTDAERVANQIAGPRNPTDPQSVVPTKSYMRNNFPAPAPGKLGIAKKETKTASDARKVALDWMKRLKAAGHGDVVDAELKKSDLEDMATELGSPAAHFINDTEAASKEADAVQKEAFDFLTNELSYHPMELTALEPGPMVGKVMQAAKRLSAAVSLPVDANSEQRAAFKALDDLGYKMVWGTDIGHQLSEPIAEPAIIASQRRLARKLASALGVNTEHFTNDAPGNVMKQDILRRWQEGANDGKVRFTAGMNASRYYAWIAQQVEDTPLSTAGRTIFAAFRRTHADSARLLVQSGKATDMEDAYHQIQNELGAANSTFAVMGRKKFVQAATAVPDELKALNRMNGVDEDTPLLTVKQAEWMHRQALAAAAARPMSMMGLSKWEDVFRASFTPLGHIADRKIPALSTLAARSAELPNDLIRARDALKFKYSPIFSARRVVKTAVKMAVYGVDAPTVTPLKALARMGETVPLQAARFLDRIYPEDAGARNGWDATDRFLQANDLFGYSPRHFQAYAAWDLKNQGKSIPEIRQALDKMFTYGDRTALERSLNTVWYPFSFEKSLYKGLGGYLLDNPGQRLALAGALDAYHAVDQHVGIQKWLDKHLPVARELEKLNAFTEGVGLGQFKGINAPLLNMFLPQHNKTPLSSRVLTAAVPAWNDLNALLIGYDPKTGKANLGGQIGDTLKVSYWYAANQAQDVQNRLTGTKPSILAQHRPAEDAAGQNEDGWQLRNALITGLSETINYNYHNPHAPYVFGSGPDVPPELRGQKIDRTTIGQLTQRFFPLFDPTQAAPAAEAKQAAADKFVAQATAANPTRGAAFKAFQQAADKVNGYETKGQYDTAQLAGITQNFRNVAVNLSETDAGFLKFYNTYYLRLFGPIQNVTG